MPLETAKHFDAPRPPSAVETSMRIVGTRWGAILALLIVTTCAFLGVAGILTWVALARAGSDAAVRGTGAAVVLDAQAGAADAAAVGALIRSIPGVAGATFRAKEDAVREMVARGMPPPDGRNPLPDVWVLHVRSNEAGSNPGARLSAAATAAAALPHVAAVRFDTRWAERLDRGEAARREFVEPLLAGTLGALGLTLLGAAFLGGGALSHATGAGKSALALVAVYVGIVAAMAAFLIVTTIPALANRMPPVPVEAGSTTLADALPTRGMRPELATLWGCGVVLLGLGLIAGAAMSDSRRE